MESASDNVGGGERGGSGVPIGFGLRIDESALRFEFSRSGGPGGQNVNKRSTRVQLRVEIGALPLDEAGRARLRRLAGPARLVGEELLITDGRRRSQRRNMDSCIERLGALVEQARQRPKTRRATRPTRGSVERRLEAKRQRGEKKRRRREPGW